jgi:hypothetical protein
MIPLETAVACELKAKDKNVEKIIKINIWWDNGTDRDLSLTG